MTRNWFLFVASSAFVLAVSPATFHAVRGNQENSMSVADCISSGTMTTWLFDQKSPTSYQAWTNVSNFVDGQGQTHGFCSMQQEVYDATSYTDDRFKVFWAPKSTMGNAQGNNRKIESSATGTYIGRDNTGEYALSPECTDCDEGGQWTVVLKQRVWQKVWVGWQPAVDAALQTVQKQVPEYLVRLQALGIDDTLCTLEVKATPGANFTAETEVTCDSFKGSTLTGKTVTIEHTGQSSFDDADGSWKSPNPWTTNDYFNFTAQAYWDLETSTTFQCANLVSKLGDVTHVFEWRMAIDDQSTAQFNFNPGVMSNLQAKPEYGTLIMIWQIVVDQNCDTSITNCPCTQFQAPDPGQPDQ